MKFYKDTDGNSEYFYILFLKFDDRVYYFYNKDDNSIGCDCGDDDWEYQTEIQYKDLSDKMKSFLKSIRFKSAMKALFND